MTCNDHSRELDKLLKHGSGKASPKAGPGLSSEWRSVLRRGNNMAEAVRWEVRRKTHVSDRHRAQRRRVSMRSKPCLPKLIGPGGQTRGVGFDPR